MNDIYAETVTSVLTADDILLISFDIETTGSDPLQHAMVAFGAVAMSAKDVNNRCVLGRFRGQIKIPNGYGFEERCEKEFWDNNNMKDAKTRVLSCQTEPSDVMYAFVQWILQLRDRLVDGEARRVRFLTDAAYFDAGWMSLYLMKYANHYPLHTFFSEPTKSRFKPIIDTNAFFRGVAGTTVLDELAVELARGRFSASKAARDVLSIPDDEVPDVEHDHDPLNDAENILKEYQIIVKYVIKRKQL
uniref:Uncharacterized protein n=1 Tax=Marseillevirus LCMAC102 TaxID=2506603 RepID=A0A481YU19_9VIRU|nr:MAG: hypothetical protein LCMAC102_04480 [Marseillevirus LCMAC102]